MAGDAVNQTAGKAGRRVTLKCWSGEPQEMERSLTVQHDLYGQYRWIIAMRSNETNLPTAAKCLPGNADGYLNFDGWSAPSGRSECAGIPLRS